MLALVPARGGSKRISRKNIKSLAGVPLFLWTLYPFRGYDPVVSSDDPEILDLAKKNGFRCLERPKELSQGEPGSSVDTTLHALKALKEEVVLLLQPTSPFRDPEMVDRAIKLYKEDGRTTIAGKKLKHVFINNKPQEGDFWSPTGSCYVTNRRSLEEHRTFLPPGYRIILDEGVSSFEIDTGDDWEIAEAIALHRVPYIRM